MGVITDVDLGKNNPMYGKPAKHRRAIIQFDKEDNLIKEYDFICELKSSGGYIWRYK